MFLSLGVNLAAKKDPQRSVLQDWPTILDWTIVLGWEAYEMTQQ